MSDIGTVSAAPSTANRVLTSATSDQRSQHEKSASSTTATSTGTTEPTTYGTLASTNGSTIPTRGSLVNITA